MYILLYNALYVKSYIDFLSGPSDNGIRSDGILVLSTQRIDSTGLNPYDWATLSITSFVFC